MWLSGMKMCECVVCVCFSHCFGYGQPLHDCFNPIMFFCWLFFTWCFSPCLASIKFISLCLLFTLCISWVQWVFPWRALQLFNQSLCCLPPKRIPVCMHATVNLDKRDFKLPSWLSSSFIFSFVLFFTVCWHSWKTFPKWPVAQDHHRNRGILRPGPL